MAPEPVDARPSRPERGLVGYFATASLLTLALATAVAGHFFASAERRDFIEQSEQFAIRVVAHLREGVREMFPPPSPAGATGFIAPATAEEAARLDVLVRRAISGLGVARVYFIDPAGSVVYSTVLEHGGKRIVDPAFAAALGSLRPATRLFEEAEELDAGGEAPGPVLESYVPVLDERGRAAGVIEIYQEAGDLDARIAAASHEVAVACAVGVALTAGVLFLVFLRGDRIIGERTEALRRANAALAELTDELERKVRDRTAKLLEQERLAAIGTLATGIAHEINNPLASISGAAEGLIRRADRGGLECRAAEAREYLEIIRDEAFRAKAITRDLLDLARRESPAGPAAPAPVDVNALVRSVAALMKVRPSGPRPCALELDLARDGELPPVLGHAAKLRQVIFNVTDNAIEAVAETGGRVRWTTALERRAGGATEVVLRCEDDGAGLDEEARRRAFEPFFTTKEPGRGTGLGLAICRGIVESHGGAIAIESEGPGRGAVVAIRLPAASPIGTGAAAAGARS